MRILQVCPYDLTRPGGVQAHVRQLGRALQQMGEQVVVVGPGPHGTVREPDRPAEIRLGGSRSLAINGAIAPLAWSPVVLARLRGAIAALRPDVVHVHEPIAPLVGPAAVTTGLPTVATVHAFRPSTLGLALGGRIVRPVVSRAEDLIAVSAAARACHAGAMGLPHARFTVIPNGVDVAYFAGGAPNAERGASVVFVGRLEPRKGAMVLADALPALLERHPEATVTFVGDGPQAPDLRRTLSTWPPDRARCAGQLGEAELAEVLRSAAVVVAPALHGESFGIVLLEAMAAGAAVVASDLPGYRSVVVPHDNGLLVPPGDSGALASAIAALLDDPDRRTALTSAGERTAAAHDWAVVADRVRDRYRRLV